LIVRHTLSYTAVKLLPAIASMVALMLFTRLMSPDQLGEYSLTINAALVFVAILGNFLVIGLGRFEPATKSRFEREKLHSTVLASAFLLNVFVGGFTLLLGVLDYLPDLSINYVFFVVLFMVSLLLMMSQKLVNANLKPKAYGLSLALKNILLLVIGVVSLLTGYGVHGVLIGMAVASLFASLPALSLWAKTSWLYFDFRVLRELWSYGAPLTLLYLFVMIISFSDRIFIDALLGSGAVGLYSAGYDLTQYSLALIPSIVHLAAFPVILKSYENDGEDAARAYLSTSFRILLLVTLPVTFGFIAVKEEVSAVFLGDAFSETSAFLIPVLSLSVLLSAVKSYYFDYAFQITKTTWLQSIPPMLAAVCNCVLNYFLIKRLGVIGAAYATMISYAAYLVLTIVLSRKVFRLPDFPWSFFVKVFLASMAMMAMVVFSSFELPLIFSLLIKVIFGVSVFCILVLIFAKKELLVLLKDGAVVKNNVFS